MSSAEVQARLKAISEAAEKDDFTGLTDGEIFGIIYNRYFVNFGNVNFGGNAPGVVNNNDLDLVREQYQSDLGKAFGDVKSKFSDCYAEMLGCAGMSPVEKQQYIAAQYNKSGLPLTYFTYRQMIYDMNCAGALDDETYHSIFREIGLQVDVAALGSHYVQYGNFNIANPQQWYFEFWMKDVAWETLWGSVLKRIATEDGYSKETKDNLHETINNFK